MFTRASPVSGVANVGVAESPHSPSGTGPVLETAHTTPLAARRSRAPPRRRPHAAPPRAGGLGHTDTPPRPTAALALRAVECCRILVVR